MSEQLPIQFLSLAQDESYGAPLTEQPIDHPALGDRIPFTLRSGQMAAFVAMMSPEQQEAFEVKMAQQQEELRLWERRNARQTLNTSSVVIRVTLSDLSPEILTRIFLYLPFASIVICSRINHHLQTHISKSMELQYYIHLGIYGLVDNPLCNFPISERLGRLLAKEHRWEDLTFDFDKRVDIPFQFRSSDTKLTTGVFSGTAANEEFHYMKIPSAPDQEVEWQQARSEKKLISPGTCAYDRDLHILVTAQPLTTYVNAVRPRTIHEVQVHLNQLSTGQPHPDAQLATISFETLEEFSDPCILVECAGDNLMLTLRDRGTRNKPKDQVCVYEWKTGELKLTISAPFRSYLHVLYLTTDIFLLPNSLTGELEYWRIPQSTPEPTSHQPFFTLSLPRLRPGSTFRSIDSRAEPSPGTQSTDASKPFYSDPQSTIAIFNVAVQLIAFASTTDFTFLVHRSSLLGCLEKFSTFISSDDRPEPVPYDDWGPPVCRWFNRNRVGWLATTFGQVHIASPPKAETEAAPLSLLDFNPIAVARVLAAEKRRLEVEDSHDDSLDMAQNEGQRIEVRSEGDEGTEQGTKGKAREVPLQTREHGTLEEMTNTGGSFREPRLQPKAVTRAMDPLNDPYHCFKKIVYSSLPYTVRSSQDKYNFDAFLLDEESILGIQMVGPIRMKELHIFHYG